MAQKSPAAVKTECETLHRSSFHTERSGCTGIYFLFLSAWAKRPRVFPSGVSLQTSSHLCAQRQQNIAWKLIARVTNSSFAPDLAFSPLPTAAAADEKSSDRVTWPGSECHLFAFLPTENAVYYQGILAGREVVWHSVDSKHKVIRFPCENVKLKMPKIP